MQHARRNDSVPTPRREHTTQSRWLPRPVAPSAVPIEKVRDKGIVVRDAFKDMDVHHNGYVTVRPHLHQDRAAHPRHNRSPVCA